MNQKLARTKHITALVITGIIVITTVGCTASATHKEGMVGKDTEIENQENEEQIIEEIIEEIEEEISIPDEVRASEDAIIQRLVLQTDGAEALKEILANVDQYPYALIELAAKKPETIPFVHSYTDYLNGVIEASEGVPHPQSILPLFIQWDARWGYDQYGDNYMAINGCGPTSLAMVVVGLTDYKAITPKDMKLFSEKYHHYVANVGTSWSLMTEGAKQFGLRGEAIVREKQVIQQALANGQPIIASMKPGDFTDGGHFIVLTGVTEDGKIIVNDSDSIFRSQKTWNVDLIIEQSKGMWKFSPL